MQNLHITLGLDFTLVERILDMPGNNGLILAKKLRHLCLGEPDCLIFHPDLDVEFPALRLVHDDLVLVGDRQRLFFAHLRLL